MKGSEIKFIAYMQGSNKRFVIPVYQRNYDWKTENCKQLYDDLVKVVRNDRKSHFFGSIVSVFNPDGANDEFLIIDGQQRITTVSLLFIAIYNLIENKVIVPKSPYLSQKIYEEYLVDKWQNDDTRIKLKPVKNDSVAFCKLFEDMSEHIKNSNLTINYNYYYERIKKEEITADELYDAISKLEIISITLNYEDNAQLIFESLNSTGVALSEGDKIRNFILMGLPSKLQNEYYEKYWNRIEVCTDYDVSLFIRDYLSVKQQATPSLNKIYFTFKAYVDEGALETEPLLQDLLFYAKNYEVLIKGNTANRQLNACIYRLNRLETTVTRPFFLEVLRMWSEEKLDIAQVADIFYTTEIYLFRRTICDLPTNMLNKIFLMLHKEIVRFDGSEENYVAKFKYALLAKKERARFPDNKEFKETFENRQIYQMNSKNKIYIFERFENDDTKETHDVYRRLDDGEYTIEHIMPQHLTASWVTSLGSDYEQIHELWLHRMANLTLTAYNAKYSNSAFKEKKTIKNGFLESGIRMNQYIARFENWGPPELEERNRFLMSQALKIWRMPVSEFKPEEKQLDSFTLDDEVDLTGRAISRFSYKNMEQPVISWIDMYERVLKMLHAEDMSVLPRLAYANDDNIELSQYVSTNKAALRGHSEIDEGLFVEKNTSTGTKIALLRRFFKLYDADPTDLVFYLKDDSESDEMKPIGASGELRKRYWRLALDYINQANEANKSFANVNPCPESWISGYFGIGGFIISCVVNLENAKVELYLGKPNKEENKAAFDRLLKNKSDIEETLGTTLVWARSDELKSSRVYKQLDNVSIANETDWPKMAKFHAEWSKKFYDVIVPYLR